MDVLRPRWSTPAFLVYAGGLLALGSAAGWLSYLAASFGHAAYVAWSLVVLMLLAAAAETFRRSGHRITGGVFAFAAVAVFVAFVAALWTSFGWQTGFERAGLRGLHSARLLLELLWLAAALGAMRRFRAPVLVVHAASAGWLLVADALSGGGTWTAVLTVGVGIGYLLAAVAVDDAYGFWLHVAAGVLIGGSLLYFWHSGTVEWLLVVIASVAYVLFAERVGRSSWAVLGALGLLLASVHFSLSWAHIKLVFFGDESSSSNDWAPPLVFTCTALLLVVLGVRSARAAEQQV